ncbi:Calcium/calmodulin-dependent protein kinase type I [Diplodia seriata]|uniref:Calcium/calmodulin-dependent protein kinase type I n=1 Tax=Diplodia seriata TaxID=420778 RepID=A0ABR3CK40_9PEZI
MSAPPNGAQPQIQPCRYKTGKTLGAGSYSVVKECVHIDTGRYYAAKVINKRLMAGREHMVRNEIAVLKRVSMGHQNILTLVDYFETMNNLYLVTDLALGGELFDRICRKGSYYESDAADLIRATLSAVAYLHDHGIVHRDLKPENLLFRTPEDNADLLIADFGLSRIMDEEQFHVLTTTCGTPGYMAPEIFKKTGHGKPVDIWAIGVITYFLLCGYTPFDRDSNLEEMQAILVADYSFTPLEYWRGVSQTAREFIKRCLTIDPTKRMTSHEALSHPWIADPTTNTPQPGGGKEDLLPTVKKNFNARRTLHAAIDTIRAINQLRAGGGAAAVMDGARSNEPGRDRGPGPAANIPRPVEGEEEAMDIDGRADSRGQTEEMIRAQEQRIRETQQGMWAAQRDSSEESGEHLGDDQQQQQQQDSDDDDDDYQFTGPLYADGLHDSPINAGPNIRGEFIDECLMEDDAGIRRRRGRCFSCIIL